MSSSIQFLVLDVSNPFRAILETEALNKVQLIASNICFVKAFFAIDIRYLKV